MALGERQWVVQRLLEGREWQAAGRAVKTLLVTSPIGSTPEGQQVLAELFREGLRACAAAKETPGSGQLAGQLIRWLDATDEAGGARKEDFFHAIEAASASPFSHRASEWALTQAVLRGHRPTTGHFLTVFECLAAAENWVGISNLFGMMVDVGKGQVPSAGALKAAMPGLVWQWRPDEVLEISRRTVEWSSMDVEQLREKGARMLSDLVSAYAAAGERMPPSRPDADIHFLPLPVRGLMAVLRLWESWLGKNTFTDDALIEAMSACNKSGHHDHTLALLDAVTRRAPSVVGTHTGDGDGDGVETIEEGAGSRPGDAEGATSDIGDEAAGNTEARLPPPPEVFALALEACAGRVRQRKAKSADRLSKQIILLMQALGVQKDASVYAGLIACCRGNVPQAIAHLERMEEEGHGYPAKAVNAAMRVCINGGEVLTALALAKRLPVEDWDGQTVRLMSICHDRKRQTGSLIRIIQRLQERRRDGRPIVLPSAEDYARLAKAAHKAHGQRRKPWEVLELCLSAGLAPSEELILTVSEACVAGRLWRHAIECLDVGLEAGVAQPCRDSLALHAYEACAASRNWGKLKEVRFLMAEWGTEIDGRTRSRLYELARNQREESRQPSQDSSQAGGGVHGTPWTPRDHGEGGLAGSSAIDAGEDQSSALGIPGSLEAVPDGALPGIPDGTPSGTSVVKKGNIHRSGRRASAGIGPRVEASTKGFDVDPGGPVEGTGDGAGNARKSPKSKKGRPSAVPEDPLGPLAPPEGWWEDETPPGGFDRGDAGRQEWGLLEAVRWLEVKVGRGSAETFLAEEAGPEGMSDSRLSLERWSHLLVDEKAKDLSDAENGGAGVDDLKTRDPSGAGTRR